MRKFWQEEIRSYPHGGTGAAVWVVRRDGSDLTSPLNILFSWATGRGRSQGLDQRPPLGALLKAMLERREELAFQSADTALWVEPLADRGQVRGCLAIWFQAEQPWRESIFLWGQRLAARLGPVLMQLEPHYEKSFPSATPAQGCLFPHPEFGRSRIRAGSKSRTGAKKNCLPMPRPVSVSGIPGCIGCSREMNELGKRIPDIARSGVNVLLKGESGTGKEVIAQALHQCSERAKGEFVGQNCAALPASLFESELFGHRAGAFTGASGEKKGLLAAAHGGTFFLDEIGDMPMELQIKLLRVMQERSVRRIGELQSRPVDIRFLAASHKELPAEIAAGRFRLDLYYRLKVVALEIPPLRNRPEDVLPLFSYFLKKSGKEFEKYTITEKAIACLQAWRWPGNVRELENEVQRFLALYPQADIITLGSLSQDIQTARTGRVDVADLGTLRELGQAQEILERYLIRKAIAATEGRKASAARRLGLSRQGLYKKIQRYGMSDLIASAET
ncbi:MAG: sigma 54-interacting transcriptional regulator [Candidatus Krumholzibacteriota bacterium]